MSKTHGRDPSENHCQQSKKVAGRAPSCHGQGNFSAGKKAKVTVRELTISFCRYRRGGCDALRSSRSFRLFLEKAAGFTPFAVEN
jgi:hypothetical protein